LHTQFSILWYVGHLSSHSDSWFPPQNFVFPTLPKPDVCFTNKSSQQSWLIQRFTFKQRTKLFLLSTSFLPLDYYPDKWLVLLLDVVAAWYRLTNMKTICFKDFARKIPYSHTHTYTAIFLLCLFPHWTMHQAPDLCLKCV
jgi:hypothetical protein